MVRHAVPRSRMNARSLCSAIGGIAAWLNNRRYNRAIPLRTGVLGLRVCFVDETNVVAGSAARSSAVSRGRLGCAVPGADATGHRAASCGHRRRSRPRGGLGCRSRCGRGWCSGWRYSSGSRLSTVSFQTSERAKLGSTGANPTISRHGAQEASDLWFITAGPLEASALWIVVRRDRLASRQRRKSTDHRLPDVKGGR